MCGMTLCFPPQAHCGDSAVDAKVNEKVAQFCAAAAKHPDKVHQVGCGRAGASPHDWLKSASRRTCSWHSAGWVSSSCLLRRPPPSCMTDQDGQCTRQDDGRPFAAWRMWRSSIPVLSLLSNILSNILHIVASTRFTLLSLRVDPPYTAQFGLNERGRLCCPSTRLGASSPGRWGSGPRRSACSGSSGALSPRAAKASLHPKRWGLHVCSRSFVSEARPESEACWKLRHSARSHAGSQIDASARLSL